MGRLRFEHDACVPPLVVKTEINEIRSVTAEQGTHRAASRALGPPDLEQVGEITVESDRQQQANAICAEISHGETVKQGGTPNEDRPRHMQQVFLQDDAPVVVDVGIGEIDAEDAIVVREIRPQQQRLKSVDQQLEMREVTGIAIE
jgi:hypothetical protein